MNPSTVFAERPHAVSDQQRLEENVELGSAPAVFESSAAVRANHAFFARKYWFERMAGVGLLILSAPLTILLCGAVKLTSRGPGFYRQKRVGLAGGSFDIIKLRTMILDSEPAGQAVWCVKRDPRITWLGRILRKTHLDELPQLWNVARGDMSLVGPRPERPEICEELASRIPRYYDRNLVKPGVTGLAQINLPPDESFADVQRKQVLDLRYIEEAGFWLEARILAATGLRMIGLRGETVMKSMRLCRSHLLPSETSDQHVSESEPRFAYSSTVKPR